MRRFKRSDTVRDGFATAATYILRFVPRLGHVLYHILSLIILNEDVNFVSSLGACSKVAPVFSRIVFVFTDRHLVAP